MSLAQIVKLLLVPIVQCRSFLDYPTDSAEYDLIDEIGRGATASVGPRIVDDWSDSACFDADEAKRGRRKSQ